MTKEQAPAPKLRRAVEAELAADVEAVRRRAGMFVGNTGPMGMTHLALELVSNALAEHLAGNATRIDVCTRHGLTVSDDGRGMTPEVLGGAWVLGGPQQYLPDTHTAGWGLGLLVVAALSSVLVVTSDRDRRFQRVFVQGRPVTASIDVGPPVGRGTTVHLVPDSGIFGDAAWMMPMLTRRLQELAVLHPALTLTLDGETIPSHGGLLGWARHLAGGATRREVTRSEQVGDVAVEVAVAWAWQSFSGTRTTAFANTLASDGAHLRGLELGLRGTEPDGRVALVAVTLPHAVFDGRYRRTLRGDAIRSTVRDVVRRALGSGPPGRRLTGAR